MKNLASKKWHLFSSLCIIAVSLLFVFAKTKPNNDLPVTHINIAAANKSIAAVHKSNLYDSLKLGSLGLAQQAFDCAMKGFTSMKEMGKIENSDIISIIDFTKSSCKKRLFVIDLKNRKILFNTYVAHGSKSGKEFAEQFSNIPESNQSSLGFYETLGTYIGAHGYSLRLQGIEKGINDNANKRDIVVHAADYVNEGLARTRGYIGRSWGCPALPTKLHKPIIDKIKNGTCLFIYSPDRNYLSQSTLLNQQYASRS
ncbi:MAG: murein L,D-transpeptidase catalytic domain family protein [Sphingobacteriales bacterium]|nr:murein L,D-transpeptidase catalytic domain family protein [Sphingobacteriales bacterium]